MLEFRMLCLMNSANAVLKKKINEEIHFFCRTQVNSCVWRRTIQGESEVIINIIKVDNNCCLVTFKRLLKTHLFRAVYEV